MSGPILSDTTTRIFGYEFRTQDVSTLKWVLGGFVVGLIFATAWNSPTAAWVGFGISATTTLGAFIKDRVTNID